MDDTVARAEALGRDLAEVAARGEPARLNRELVAAIGAAGLFDRVLSPDGVTARELCAIRRGLARSCPEAETAFAVQGLGSVPILLFGSEEAKERWLPGIRSGELVAAFALTEPGAGSDAAAIATRAERDGDGWRLHGEKVFISNAPEADVATVFARTSDQGSRGVTAFVVPMDGVPGEPIQLISPHPIGRWVFDGTHVGPGQLLGEVDAGFRVAMATLDLFRPSVGAAAVGMAETALRIAVEHAREREAFGSPIASFQGISHQLADVRTRIEAAALLVEQAADTYDAGDRETLTGRSAMAKLFATEMAQKAVDVAIQVLGARALESDHTLAHLYEEVRALRIYEGTSEIQRNIISRELFRERI
ncbi:MAG: acyl-CoA dehydrogenase family protein [Actinomycetes bacterium]|jgi:acyl-CoA dehydrogenase|nr:MAG: acyl-CoA dehydrogenase [Actinomycetota bacterium]